MLAESSANLSLLLPYILIPCLGATDHSSLGSLIDALLCLELARYCMCHATQDLEDMSPPSRLLSSALRCVEASFRAAVWGSCLSRVVAVTGLDSTGCRILGGLLGSIRDDLGGLESVEYNNSAE